MHQNTQDFLDTSSRVVKIHDSKCFHYAKRLIANGTRNFRSSVPGIDKKGSYTLNTLKEAWHIIEHIKDKKAILFKNV